MPKFNPIDHNKQKKNPRLDQEEHLNKYEVIETLMNLELRYSGYTITIVQFFMLLIDIVALIIYIDLYMVNKYKRHVFTFVFEWKIIAQKQLKPYRTAYNQSLLRNWFCVLDQVQLDGFLGMKRLVDLLTVGTIAAIFLNLFDLCNLSIDPIFRSTGKLTKIQTEGEIPIPMKGVSFSAILFYIQFPMWFITFLFGLTCYVDLRNEACFHCKYGYFFLQTLSNLINIFVVMEYFPTWAFVCAGLLLGLVIVVRNHNLAERKEKYEKRLQRQQNSVDPEDLDKVD